VSTTEEREIAESTLPDLGVHDRQDATALWRIHDDDPLSAHFECARDYVLEGAEWSVRVLCSSTMWADAEAFHVQERLEAFDAGKLAYSTERSFDVPRDMP